MWEHTRCSRTGLITTCGKPLEVIHPGHRNIHAGADFTGALIRIGGLVWGGSVEVHLRSGDWKRHGHHLDPAYNNVILHVILHYEGEIINASGQQVPSCRLKITEPVVKRAEQLFVPKCEPACGPFLGQAERPFLFTWIRQLGRKRSEQKSHPDSEILSNRALSREECFFRILGRGFGLPVNAAPFEWLVSMIPYSLMAEARHSLPDLEAILFGQAGFLGSPAGSGSYYASLTERYRSYRKYLQSGPLDPRLWKYLRLRPAAFPTVRIAQFASLLHHRIPLIASILEAGSLPEMEQRFRVKASEFWDTHYLFQRSASQVCKFIGPQTFHILVINAVVPFLRALGHAEKRKKYTGRAHDLLLEVEAESNHVIKKWITFGVRPGNALESQGLIQLYWEFCSEQRCLFCKLGISILEDSMNEKP